MRSFVSSIFVLLLAGTFVAGQTAAPKTGAAKSAEKPAASGSTKLPTEETVDAFLKQQFGYQTDLSWKISYIRPSLIDGLAEVTVILASPQGQQLTRFYVGADGEHALGGEIIPFGAWAEGRASDHCGIRRPAVSGL